MDSKLIVLGIAFAVILSGCVNLSVPESETSLGKSTETELSESAEVDLYKAQLAYDNLNEKYTDTKADFKECEDELEACSNSATAVSAGEDAECETIECPICDSPEPADCSAIQNDLNLCEGNFATCNNNLGACNTAASGNTCDEDLLACKSGKEECETNLETALAKVPGTLIKHKVPGNFYISGDYRYVNMYYLDVATIKKVIVGLDYGSEGDDAFFYPGNNWGLIRWYTLTTSDSGATFTSDIDDDTVKIESNNLYIKKDEFAAGTSKEGYGLDRALIIHIYDEE